MCVCVCICVCVCGIVREVLYLCLHLGVCGKLRVDQNNKCAGVIWCYVCMLVYVCDVAQGARIHTLQAGAVNSELLNK